MTGLALFGFYLPSSIGGVISKPLTMVALVGMCGFLIALLAGRHSVGRPSAVVHGLGMVGVLIFATLMSPFNQISPGVIVLYVGIALLFCLNLRDLRSPRLVVPAFAAISILSMAAGLLIALDSPWIDNLLKTHYQAFRPDLLESMLDRDKPILTFATHSMAAFMIYLLFFMTLRTYAIRGGRIWLAAMAVYMVLLLALTATTAYFMLGLAVVQLGLLITRRHPRVIFPLAATTMLLTLIVVVWSGVEARAVTDELTLRLIGDREHGFIARYATKGLLATNFRFLAQHPIEPIGFGYSTALYLGDSGVVVTLLRGSLPLLFLTYGGLFVFLRQNLTSQRTALWLWLVTIAFEVGFTPLQYFRFVAFLPFAVVYLNTICSPAIPAPHPAADSRL